MYAYVLLAGTFIAVLDFFIVNVSLPDIQGDLRATDAAVELIVAGYAVAYAAALIVGGRLGDGFGRKRMFVTGVASFTLASALCGLASSEWMLVAGRLAQGSSAAMFSPQVLAIFAAELGPAAKSRALVAYGFVMGLASVFAQLVGGALIALDPLGAGWRACFLINVPIGVAVCIAALRVTPESRAPAASRPDVPGMLLVFFALVALTFPMIEGRQHGWPMWAFMLLAAAGLLFAAFIAWESARKRRGMDPLVDLDLFRHRPFAVGLLAQVVFYMSMAGFYLVLAIYLQQGRGLTPLASGMIFVANGAGYLLTSMLADRVLKWLDGQAIALAAAMRAAGLGLLYWAASTHDTGASLLWLVPGLAMNGAGTGFAVSPLAAMVLARIEPRHIGAASGVLTTGLQVGNAIGVATIGLIFYSALASRHTNYSHAFCSALAGLLGLCIALIAVVQLLPKRRTSAND